MAWLKTLDVGDIIREFREELHEIRKAELARSLNKLPELSDAYKREVEYLTERIVNKILNHPTQVLRKEATRDVAFRYIDALKSLFGLK
jgi:glutamyl-tRNA reductase